MNLSRSGARSGVAALLVPLLLGALVPVPALAPGSGSEPAARQPFAGVVLRQVVPAGDRAWPLPGPPVLTRAFDPPAQPWLPGHRGVDLAGSAGAVVRAVAPGVVFFAGPVAGRGVVSVAHPGGLRTTYQPVVPAVSTGDLVAAGDPVGTLAPGHAGCPVAACLHWGLRRGESYLDPLALVGLGRLRLLPAHSTSTT